ncbi:glycerol uptake operon antiterminator [Tissierella praeacuta DSM 18095]|uniref:Glycerol uptake operon antiterminator n=1 Tax=Tissierella praeacuta DSM 18095 TaxID=1123404 RepID=A0A1M4S592_9FIRM|nr:glycerol-3-phosphate responsive antiterminator [Tissierella praeacuta]TCU71599.1 glycerol uptake operon antiterminator [Tissierella praeacuta]SHE27361.1 glycerol uptake operon antiterminator [Tissierella praeacuta DSM 18095]SUP00875.1 Glycerol-3-phosphate responsive antiterminator [Tissierella praeacuta]
MVHFFDRILRNPIIATVQDLNRLDDALKSPCEIIFLTTGNIFYLKEITNKIRLKNKGIYIYIDSIDGFSKDTLGLEYIIKNISPDGIITEKSHLVKLSKDMGVFTIQRLFISNSYSLNNGISSIKQVRPNAIELLPGIMPKIIKNIIDETKISVIASGLITDKYDLNSSLDAGAIGIATSNKILWDI